VLTAPEKVGFSNTATIERKAQNIGDPIARLKYLRRVTAEPEPPKRRNPVRYVPFCLAVLLLTLRSDARLRHATEIHHAASPSGSEIQGVPNVWRVEATKDYEVFSNGLRIENDLAVANQPRSYRLISVDEQGRTAPPPLNPMPALPRPPHPAVKKDLRRLSPVTDGLPFEDGRSPSQRNIPAGIVFHTTESDQVPFEPGQQRNLQRITRDTLLFVRNKRAYHFLIDRFGRVHRIVAESDSANHAGNSIWADSRWLYLELNQSFLGVAFEAAMQNDQARITEAQTHSAKVLTEMLRSKYNIPAANCVTHAQVSVNPDNMRIGWHSDWGKGFPFHEVGLPDNYQQALPSLYLMGFEYDTLYVNSTGPGIWQGLATAEERLREASEAHRMPVPRYRALLRRRYSDEIRALHQWGADEEN